MPATPTSATAFHAVLRREPLHRDRQTGFSLPLAATSAVAFSLLAGCTGHGAIHSASAASADRAFAGEAAKSERAVGKAEAAVAKAPQEAALRADLGRAYLAAGRFESARTALSDAMTLGDDSGRTALSLALAQIGSGQFRSAVALLDEHRNDIPAGDLGLALALAGESSRGVAILADAVRGGENTPKLRQNLAYAFALDGRWAEAKVMAAQDVPAAELDRRLALWALSTLPDRGRDRVAGLLGAPVRRDQGQPDALALKVEPAAPRMADAAAEPALASELPAAAEPAPSTVATNLAAQSAPAPAAASAATAVVPANLAAPLAPASQPTAHQPAVAIHRAPAMASLAQAFSGREYQTARFQPLVRPAPARAKAMVAAMARPVAGSSHVVQLGAFSSEKNARRAWGIYTHQNPTLAAYRPVIVPAVIKGKQLWRVAAGGFAGRFAANDLCSRLKSRGGACFAYVLPSRATPAPATMPGHDVGATLRARR